MDLHNKTKDELINELQKLQAENFALKASYEKCLSEQKQLEEEFITATEKAKEKNRFKAEFQAIMSHEIRPPLNSVIGFSEILLDEGLTDSKRKEIYKILVQSSKKLWNNVGDFFDVLFVDSERKVCISEVSINEIIKDSYSPLKYNFDKKGIQFSYKRNSPEDDVLIYSDGLLILETFDTLLTNADRFTENGSVEFGYVLKNAGSTSLMDETGETIFEPTEVEFYVKDTGIGIPQKEHQTAFEAFGLHHYCIEREIDSLGLDLFIAKSYVEILGGTIRLESEEGKGTTVYFTVPQLSPLSSEIKPQRFSKFYQIKAISAR
jgi:signal transduction histidine kinase